MVIMLLGALKKCNRGALFWCAFAILYGANPIMVSADNSTLKAEAIKLEVEARQFLDQGKYPLADSAQLSLYIGLDDSSWVLHSAAISLDGQKAIHYRYSPLEVESLHKNGLHRIAKWEVSPGIHQINAKFIAVKKGGTVTGARNVFLFDKEIQLGQGVGHLELRLARTGMFKMFRKPRIHLRRWERKS